MVYNLCFLALWIMDQSQKLILLPQYTVYVQHCHFMLFILQAEDGSIVELIGRVSAQIKSDSTDIAFNFVQRL